MVIVCDLDGVVWLGDEAISGSADAIADLRAAGHRVLFVSNNSFAPVREVEDKLAGFAIPAAGDVLTSAMAAARLVGRGERVLLAGGPGAREELERRGALVVDEGPCDAVVVGFHRDFDYEELRRASSAVRAGARLIGTNGDATYPTPDGEIPGGGAILAAVATAAGVEATVAGKPCPPMADLVRSVVGHQGDLVMVGDRPDTDGRFAAVLGARFVHVLSGVRTGHDGDVPAVWLTAPDLRAAVPRLMAMAARESVPSKKKSSGSPASSAKDRAEGVVHDLKQTGESSLDELGQRVDAARAELRQAAEHVMATVQREITEQITGRSLVTRADLGRLEAKVDALAASVRALDRRMAKVAPAPKKPSKAPAATGEKKASARRPER